MRFPWKRRGDDEPSEAEKARKEAEAQWDEVREVTESLRRIRRDNHFAEAIEQIMRRGA